MDLRTYLASKERGESARIAEVMKVSPSFFAQMASGNCAISPARCVEIEKATGGQVSRKDLRPDWAAIWPEIIS